MGFRDLLLFYVVHRHQPALDCQLLLPQVQVRLSSGLEPGSHFYTPLALSGSNFRRASDRRRTLCLSKRAFGDFSGFIGRLDLLDFEPAPLPAVLYFAA